MKKYSMIGLVLLGASAVTAAFIPAKKLVAGDARVDNGLLTNSTGQGASDRTCRKAEAGETPNCTWTQTKVGSVGISATSVAGVNSVTQNRLNYTGTQTTL
ncbi:hypothetical protein [Chitinophaga deserti]|uniref:hypothetical protein n=1 Tax=Chitinophaga deserti TaxID=2164099 RepID=UPI0013006973|nr:hypothetical protein [Chitinophaga deserti]